MKARGGLPKDEWSADVGGECLANKHFTCMNACTPIHTHPHIRSPWPPAPPPNTHMAWKDFVKCWQRDAAAGTETQPSLSVHERHHSWPAVNTFWLTAFTMSRLSCQSRDIPCQELSHTSTLITEVQPKPKLNLWRAGMFLQGILMINYYWLKAVKNINVQCILCVGGLLCQVWLETLTQVIFVVEKMLSWRWWMMRDMVSRLTTDLTIKQLMCCCNFFQNKLKWRLRCMFCFLWVMSNQWTIVIGEGKHEILQHYNLKVDLCSLPEVKVACPFTSALFSRVSCIWSHASIMS